MFSRTIHQNNDGEFGDSIYVERTHRRIRWFARKCYLKWAENMDISRII